MERSDVTTATTLVFVHVLALDTATSVVVAGIASLDDSRSGNEAKPLITVRIEGTENQERRHSEALVPHISSALSQIRLKPKDIVAVVAGIGPGPFTGLRVGMVTAAAWAHAVGCPVYGVSTLDAIAWTALNTRAKTNVSLDYGDNLLVATDARRKEVYWALYTPDGQRLTAPAVNKPGDLREKSHLIGPGGQNIRPTWAVGSGALLYRHILELPVPAEIIPSVAGLVACAADRILTYQPSEQLVPLYLRRPDAVPPDLRKTVLT